MSLSCRHPPVLTLAQTVALVRRFVPKPDLFLVVLLALTSVFLLYHLDHRPFWQDEAETACLANNVLKYGVPRAFDGVNLISQEEGREFAQGDYLWRWSPWLQIYLTAAAFQLGGATTTVGRLPFALLGILCVCLVYLLIKRHYGNLFWARASALLLAFSVPFLLFARQCRYYSLSMFLVLVGLYAFHLDWPRRWGPALLLLVSFGLLFHANYLIFFSYSVAFLAVAILLYRREMPLKRTLLLVLIELAVVLQGLVLYRIQKQSAMVDFHRLLVNLESYIHDILQFMVPLPLALGLICYWGLLLWRRDRFSDAWKDRGTRFTFGIGLIILLNLLILSWAPQGEFRYLVHLLPLVAILLGWVVWKVWQYQKFSGVLLGFLLIFTNWLHLLPVEWLGLLYRPVHANCYTLTYPNFPLKLYLSELFWSYPDVNRPLIQFFQTYARPGDTVLTNYGDLPLQFYTTCRVLGGLQGRGPQPGELPDWVIKRWHTRWNRHYGLHKSEVFIRNLDLAGDYEAIRLPFEDEIYGNRADPHYHHFAVDSPPVKNLVIYRKRSKSEGDIAHQNQ